ncbi:dolichyl-phosphate-mannose-mannosyltransferase family protein [Rhodococcus sp. MTM3W5.2]|uniref:glycosyltransferase family 39 protein n=1 Tax=Rhodococcus sp. MTM3W5.2 TaxID=1805827 RepID=UPI0009795558|nr:glycosyltransferase family 39 protein [Rhodococcus sp. MTM3W5.2]AQA22248.1 dolichyl-phosphate-mannose-mannosyltransferase family protein [Rhodococcus sp. MTM3W5.2]
MAPPADATGRARWLLPLAAGLSAALIGVAWSWRPSFWWDEAATVSAADRSVPELVELLRGIDAVHGLYYLVMHGWFELFGVSELSARAPGAIAIGIGTAALVQTASLLAGTRTAVVAGAVFAIMPRITWASTEARSYAMVAALAAVAGLVLVLAMRSTSRWWWALYAVVVALSIMLFVYSAALVAAHAVTVACTRGAPRLRFVVAAAGATVLAAPLAGLAIAQAGQVSWVPPLDGRWVRTVLLDQWFEQAPWFAAGCAAVVVAGLLRMVLAGPSVVRGGDADLLRLALPAMVVPIAAFLAYSALATNIYVGRYLIFTAPSVALLVAVCLVRLFAARLAVVVAVLALGLAALPAYLAQRQPWGKQGGMDYSSVADFVGDHAAGGDCVVFQPTVPWQPTSLRAIEQARPDAFAGLVDIGFGRSGASRGSCGTQMSPTRSSRRGRRAARWCGF